VCRCQQREASSKVPTVKCQQCEKTATFHITELTGGKPQELHLCEEHARQYLTQAEEEPAVTPSLAGALAQQLAVGQTAEELSKLDQRACPVCGITFYEFRNQGRLGCPHDYVYFQNELEPLVLNIHGETQHMGKRPQRMETGTEGVTQLIRLRREMKDAIGNEDYERASELRDKIRSIEKQSG
jgi:protein arginine kinase activator